MMSRQPFTLLIHIALAIIVAGAIVTHYAGIQGELMLRDGAAPVRTFVKTSGPGDGTLPFEISLVDADIDFYPGTTTPMDFRSMLRIDGHDVNVSMNKVGEYDGWRFFQSGMDPDGSTLSVHVAIVMISYVLFLLMAVLSAVALCSRDKENEAALSRINRLILVPAVFLLGAGMFIGAVWANQSWGCYWGWDPKETCALVMFLIYSVPMHWASRPLKCFSRPRVLHWYLLLAVLSVLFTYFGANYLLPGLHSYA